MIQPIHKARPVRTTVAPANESGVLSRPGGYLTDEQRLFRVVSRRIFDLSEPE